MLFALGTPVAFAALVVSFLCGLMLRAVAIRFTARTVGLADRGDLMAPNLRRDIDPFGAVAAAIGGMGWGKQLTVDDVPRWRGRGRAAAVFAAGPVACILAGELVLAGFALSTPDASLLRYLTVGAVLHGIGETWTQQILLSLGGGLLAFGLLALIPIPPLDGFGILYYALRRPGHGMQWMRLWFEHKNIGVVLLIVFSLIPTGYPILLSILDILGNLFLRVWG
ncbi:hypothetical protein GCM10010168_89050 [Actinoplanes ianthinogenes]|uniref:Peptidase M50 n=1 Tax=Actinoplanes ianthinogenes TaxID=122358 RepID=A0ABM7LQ36_9ACTN|nr:hypothetical protein [Actinoplanes ianthinogenes]BCJ41335.1 hypothetical protein Aiant_19920 [Actinoplanes ianthinogenes]GGR56338.1 hypothetical protein GCM10010168_89050 [Actinoplanes ianthinogenes]